MNKTVASAQEAIKDIQDDMTIMLGGFGLCGIPENCIQALVELGVPAFYTPAGYGTEVAAGKEVRYFDGKPHILESALTADFAIVKAWKGDRFGNLMYKGTARNFNPVMAMAGKITIAEVEELVKPEDLDPNFIHTPGIFIQRIFQANYLWFCKFLVWTQ